MCGIAGLLRFDGRPVHEAELTAMAARLEHRGPDGDGLRCFDVAGLAHRRLAIIDVEGGVQPLCNEDATVWVSFNGEIYNYRELMRHLESAGHRFRTRCDTEVIVHAYEEWGIECVDRLRGMFAFAIWDERRQRLFLARDRVGIKPLFYFSTSTSFAFASELQAFRDLPEFQPGLDLEALDLYLHLQYIPAPYSVYKEVRKLPPGHVLTVDRDGRIAGPTRYWQLRFRANQSVSGDEWLERLDAELRETTSMHMMSDVDFGAFLSGGVDSSTVVAYMSETLDRPVKTFSISFEDPEYDEGNFAREVATRLGTEHHQEVVRADTMSVLPKLVEHYGEPFADSSALPTYYVSEMAAKHVKMVLSGDGGDENFAGYATYESMLHEHRGPTGLYRRARFGIGNLLRAVGLRAALPSPDDTWREYAAYFNARWRSTLWRPELRYLTNTTGKWFDEQLSEAPRDDLCTRYQHFDINCYLPFDILTKVDIASMAHGLEVRVPLLDHVLMELVAEMPSSWKLAPAPDSGHAQSRKTPRPTAKYLLKRNAEQFFPRNLIDRPKQGFGLPIGSWFRGELRPMLEERLTDRSGPLHDLFESRSIKRLLREHVAGRDHARRLWSLLFLDEWLHQSSQ